MNDAAPTTAVEPEESEVERVVEMRARKICEWFGFNPDEITDDYGPVLRWHGPAYHINEAIAALARPDRDAGEAETVAAIVAWLRKCADDPRSVDRPTKLVFVALADAIERGDWRNLTPGETR